MTKTTGIPRRPWVLACGLTIVLFGLESSGPELPPRAAGPQAAPGAADAKTRQALDEAVAQSNRDLAVAERSLGPAHPEIARILAGMAQSLWGLEDYATAGPLADRALSIRLKAFGPESHEAASSFYQVAELHRANGDYAGAIRFHQRALAVWQKILGPQSPEAASSLHYLGVLRLATGDLPGAKAFLTEALEARERTLGPAHELVATTLSALAEAHARAGDRATAGLLLARAQGIWERALGSSHPFVARALTGRARLLFDAGDARGARRLLEQALEVRTRAFGPDHYLVARSLADLARLEAGTAGETEALYARALDIQERHLGPSHPEVASTLAALARLQWLSGAVGPALGNALRAEAIARESFRRSAKDLADGEALRFEDDRTSGLDVALTVLAGTEPSRDLPGESAGRILDELVRSRAVVLGDQRSARRGDVPGDRPGAPDVLAALPADSPLLLYVRFGRLDRSSRLSTPEYLAIILKAPPASPRVVRLGPAATIDDLVARWRQEISSDPRLHPDGTGDRAYGSAGSRLRQAIWDPVTPNVLGARRVLVVPDGAIDLVSLATLPAAGGRHVDGTGIDGSYVVETGPPIHYLAAPADVIPRSTPSRGHGVLVMGGVDFDALPSPDAFPAVSTGAPPGAPAPLCPDLATMRFGPLAGSEKETAEVASLWDRAAGALRLSGAAASESAFKRHAPSRKVLHLATHAYSLPERCGPGGRSGLVLAGANHHADPATSGGGEDGILTAEEIAALDLSGVELAVLSACDTGVGQVLDGEGVVGLRRAFDLAGARTLVTSLWPVDDGAARVWMRGLYEKRLSGLSTVDSVRAASLDLLRAQRALGRTTHPYFWGSFVAAGDWRRP